MQVERFEQSDAPLLTRRCIPLDSLLATSSAILLTSSFLLMSPLSGNQLAASHACYWHLDLREPRAISGAKVLAHRITHAIIFPGPVLYWSTTLFKASSRLPVMYTFAPLDTNACVIIRPMPVPPPVTTAVKLETSKSLFALRSSLDLAPLAIVLTIGKLGRLMKAAWIGLDVLARRLSIST